MPLSRIRATFAAVPIPAFVAGYRFIVKDINGVVVSDQSVTGNVYVSPPLPALDQLHGQRLFSTAWRRAQPPARQLSLVGTGIESLATVASRRSPPSGGWFYRRPGAIQHAPSDTSMRIRMDFSNRYGGVYTGSDMSTPGRAMCARCTRSPPIGSSRHLVGVTAPCDPRHRAPA